MAGDTIFARSSGAPPAAIAIIRISGPAVPALPAQLGFALLNARRATLVDVRDLTDGDVIDRAIALRFAAGESATGEDVLELHVHGGRAIVRAVEARLSALGLREAEPGEFTRRAVANGRLDLLEAEALGDLLAADTETARRMASGRGSRLSVEIDAWADALLTMGATIEAAIDNDLPLDAGAMASSIAAVRTSIDRALARPSAERLRDGFLVVIAGPPNAGKSTLFNALVGRDAAIVAPTPGTTRDVIEAVVDLCGIPVRLVDTAGHRDASTDPIEAEGIERGRAVMADAALVLWLGDAHSQPIGAMALAAKADIVAQQAGVSISAVTGEGLPELVAMIVERLAGQLPPVEEPMLNARQRTHLLDVRRALASASDQDPAITGAALADARRVIDHLTGRAGIEHLLDRVFAGFCLGK